MDSTKKPEHKNPRTGANPLSQLMFGWVVPTLYKGLRTGLNVEDLTQCLKEDQSEILGDKLDVNWKKELEEASEKDRPPKLRNALFKTFASSVILDGVSVFMFVLLRTLLPVVLAQLLNQFHDRPISHEFFNDTNQLQLNRSARYLERDINQFSSIKNVDLSPQNDLLQFDELIYGNSAPPKIKRELKSDPQNVIVNDEVNKTFIFHPPKALSEKDEEFNSDSVAEEIRKFCLYAWTDMYWLATMVVMMTLFGCFFAHHADLRMRMVGARMRIACCSLIYRKTLRLSKKSSSHTSAGYIVNLLSNDVSRLDYGFIYAHYVWILPLQSALIAYLIWNHIGWASLVGVIGLLIKTIPVQTGLSRLSSIVRMKVARRTDQRVGIMHEIIQGIQSTMVFTERSTLFITNLACVLAGHTISASVVFAMAQFFNVLQLTAAIFYPLALSLGAEALVSITRVEEYLLMEEKDESNVGLIRQPKPTDSRSPSLHIDHISACWSDCEQNTLDDITVSVRPGQLCAIIGPVGSGKSSLLQLILGELPLKQGTATIKGTVSYASQEPWLFTGTVKNNILFGQTFDKKKYNEVVGCCSLKTDFEQLSNGDKTVVGERGASLSGGQKARISLARAVYQSATIYLLDDPLSAVDSHVGKHLFDEVIGPKGCLAMRNATRLLVTHQVHFLKEADLIVIMEHGKIVRQGTYAELANSNLDFAKLLEKPIEKDTQSVKNEEGVTGVTYEEDDIPYIDGVSGYQPLRVRTISSLSDRDLSKRSLSKSTNSEKEEINDEDAEEQADGGVSLRVWRKYFGAGGSYFTLTLTTFVMIFSQVVVSCNDYFVNYWTQQEEIRSNGAEATLTTTQCLYVYGALIIGVVLVCLWRGYLFFNICMRSSNTLHDKMFARILGTTMRFFDTNSSGRILNRFSRDMGVIDEMLPKALMEALQILLVMFGILIMVSIVNPVMIGAICGAMLLFGCILKLYLRPSQDLKRLEGIAKSPVFSHLTATLLGISTIRSRGLQPHLSKEFDTLQDSHSGTWQLAVSANTALGLWLDCVSTAFVACVTYSFIVLYDATFSGNVGLAISQALILTGMVQYGVRQSAESAQLMTSVERILQYTDLEQERSPSVEPPLSWPQNGHVQFVNMSLKYDPSLPAVLKNLDVDIQPGWKVGIVGRTGAGKSSLIGALFRLSTIEGQVLIDEIDTGAISLESLRSHVSIIPQDPVLFSSSVRSNLDPFHLFPDDALWKSLEDVELKSSIGSLDFMVTESGSNFSVGQRQLICLARAILRNNKVLVLDEATANVDPQTDALIQRTIREKFKECTVLTVAHRLHTVMDSDRILVMDAGCAREFDFPHILLQRPDSVLSGMVQAVGEHEAEQLRKIARDTFMKHHIESEDL
ncbi:ATP-binding cassette sub-family C member 4 [Pseudolycoriella hygida]|uniref:ATP-binding cassette sub-family C member 4 n=1 Tax=Pseudolycoriella hygida TaxID=35572 RepID=A0A9Q0RWS7_9DIPT|nr:ATP-binding cassette sub-family C member 4 [Pseudolycoriella hygida]